SGLESALPGSPAPAPASRPGRRAFHAPESAASGDSRNFLSAPPAVSRRFPREGVVRVDLDELAGHWTLLLAQIQGIDDALIQSCSGPATRQSLEIYSPPHPHT